MKKWFVTFVIALMFLAIIAGGCTKQTPEPQIQFNTLSEVKCDGKEYNLAVKPKSAVVLISTSTIREQNIDELRSSGLMVEIYEIGRNEKASDVQLVVQYTESYQGTQLTHGNPTESCNVVYLAGLPSENLDALFQKVRSWDDHSYQLLSSNTRSKDIRLSFTAKFVE